MYPGLPQCSKCGRYDHKTEDCVEVSPWKAALLGRGVKTVINNQPPPRSARVLRFENDRADKKELGYSQKGMTDREMIVIIKVCYLLAKPADGEELLWIPTQETRWRALYASGMESDRTED